MPIDRTSLVHEFITSLLFSYLTSVPNLLSPSELYTNIICDLRTVLYKYHPD